MILSMLLRQPPRHSFFYPGAGNPRIAVIHESLRTRRPARSFRPELPDLDQRLTEFAPQVIAASYEALLSFGSSVQPTHAVVVLSQAGSARLIARERDRLWQLYEVPVFEQVLSSSGQLLATECEAHDGLHILAHPGLLGYPAQLDRACDCGSATPRVPADTFVCGGERAIAASA